MDESLLSNRQKTTETEQLRNDLCSSITEDLGECCNSPQRNEQSIMVLVDHEEDLDNNYEVACFACVELVGD